MDGPVLNKSRDLSLDFLKGFSMVLVVFFHNLQLNPASVLDNIFVLLANTAVPVFFLVSGALFFHRPFTWKNHARHILQFYLAMIVWKDLLSGLLLFGCPFPGLQTGSADLPVFIWGSGGDSKRPYVVYRCHADGTFDGAGPSCLHGAG